MGIINENMHHSWHKTRDNKDESGNVEIVKKVLVILQKRFISER
jgi:hypothetical protein